MLQTPVTYEGEKYLPRMQNISVDEKELRSLLDEHFESVDPVSQDYFESKGSKLTFLLK